MPQVQTNYVFTRDLSQPLHEVRPPEGLALAWVRRTGDAGFAALDALCEGHGFGPGWAANMLGTGAEAVVALARAAAGSPTPPARAAAWLTAAEFYVDEIRHTFRPGDDGDYYFGDFVAPAWRGQRLQRLLVRERLRRSAERGRRWAYCMSRKDNPASAKSYVSEGFHVTARLRTYRVRRWQIDRLRPLRPAGAPGLPHGELSAEGRRLPFSFRVRRA